MGDVKITVVSGDDWEGIFAGDQLAAEGHHIRMQELVKVMQDHDSLHVEFLLLSQDGCDWLAEIGSFPSLRLIPDRYLVK